MLLTISTTHRPATDMGYLLHKNPAKAQTFDLSVGKAHVFYPEATEEQKINDTRLGAAGYAFTRSPDAADLSMAAMTSWR